MQVFAAVGNSVAGVLPGAKQRRRPTAADESSEDTILRHAQDSLKLSLKCTPLKSYDSVSAVSVKTGVLEKKNEQGGWHTVSACIVPHWFLYYYENERSDTPRGVIDLHCYTDATIEEKVDVKLGGSVTKSNVLTLKTPALSDESSSAKDKSSTTEAKVKPKKSESGHLRNFYFSSKDKTGLAEWISVINRERYNVVKDERDAYQSLQQSFSGELDVVMSQVQKVEGEKEETARAAATAQLQAEGRAAAAEEALTKILGALTDTLKTSESEMRVYSSLGMTEKDYNKAFEALQTLKDTHECALQALQEELSQANRTHVAKVLQLQQELQTVRAQGEEDQAFSREQFQTLQAQLQQDQAQHALDLEASQQQEGEAQSNLHLAMAARSESEEKAQGLSDAKKVLVKEVKNLRKRVQDLEESLGASLKREGLLQRDTHTLELDKSSLAAGLQKVVAQKEALLLRLAEGGGSTGIAESGSASGSGSPASLGLGPHLQRSDSINSTPTAAGSDSGLPEGEEGGGSGELDLESMEIIENNNMADRERVRGRGCTSPLSESSDHGAGATWRLSESGGGGERGAEFNSSDNAGGQSQRQESDVFSAAPLRGALQAQAARLGLDLVDDAEDDGEEGGEDEDEDEEEEEEEAWAMTGSQLRELGWLSPEQKDALEQKKNRGNGNGEVSPSSSVTSTNSEGKSKNKSKAKVKAKNGSSFSSSAASSSSSKSVPSGHNTAIEAVITASLDIFSLDSNSDNTSKGNNKDREKEKKGKSGRSSIALMSSMMGFGKSSSSSEGEGQRHLSFNKDKPLIDAEKEIEEIEEGGRGAVVGIQGQEDSWSDGRAVPLLARVGGGAAAFASPTSSLSATTNSTSTSANTNTLHDFFAAPSGSLEEDVRKEEGKSGSAGGDVHTAGTPSSNSISHLQSHTLPHTPPQTQTQTQALPGLQMKLCCGRCGGTVEGPKYSTCKCKEPLIGQTDGASSSDKMMNAMRRASSAMSSMSMFGSDKDKEKE